jgi:RHS repeat-associated protein
MNMTYNYSATLNNGRIASSADGITGENTSYTYDALNRLTNASNSLWSEAYTYDGFGNLTAKAGSGGSPNPAPTVSMTYNSKNQLTNLYYDANGNQNAYYSPSGGNTYSVENRLTLEVLQNSSPYPANIYAYDPWGKRVMSGYNPNYNSPQPAYNYTFYGITGQKLAAVTCNGSNYPAYPTCAIVGQNVYFGKKLIVAGGATVLTDRLGSVRANGQGETPAYYPYGEERTSTVDGREKFGTYFRDAIGQDYADQRYYGSGTGSFFTADPGGIKTAHPGNPTSWNRYLYVNGDPVNSSDPSGLDGVCGPYGTWMGEGCYNYSGQSGDINEAYNQYVTTLASTIGWVSGEDPVSILQAAAPNFSPPNTPCEQSVVTNTVLTDATNLGLNLSGYNLSGAVASIAGQTSGVLGSGTDSMTELVVNPSDPSTAEASFNALVASLGSSFTYAGYDPLHPGYQYSYRQNVGQYSMQISFNPNTYSLSVDIDPWNPQYGDLMSFLGHVGSVIANTLSGGDTNYQTVANALGISATPCGH